MKFTSEKDKKEDVQTTGWIYGPSKDWRCDCPRCPSHQGIGEAGYNFCALGKSTKIKEEKGCICERCPITVQTGSKYMYCCTRGTRTQNMFDELVKKLK